MKFKAIKNLSQEIGTGQVFTVSTDEEAKIFLANPETFQNVTTTWPSKGDNFYFFTPSFITSGGIWEDSLENYELLRSGNCFQERAQATLKARELKEVLNK